MSGPQFWWSDYAAPARTARGPRAAPLPRGPVAPPVTGWAPPRELPNLSGVKVLGIDTETYDPGLDEKGPGGVTGRGHIVGVSVATEDAAWYLPIAHEYQPEQGMNLNREHVLQFVDSLFTSDRDIVGANLLYDLEHLRAAGVDTQRGTRYHDVQIAEPLLDENSGSYSLEHLGNKYCGGGKDSSVLYQWCADSFGGVSNPKQRANIYRAPPSLVGPYAEQDAILPLRVLEQQRVKMAAENLGAVYDMECGLLPLLLDMRFLGVDIDVPKAHEVARWLRAEAARAQGLLGGGVDVWSSASLARAFDKAGVEYPLTENGNPSFTKDFLASNQSEIARAVLAVRQYEKAANPFVESYLLGNLHNGRVHCQFHPLRSDEYGTVSGRFSSSNPNLQNIPARDKVLGPLLRSLFIPRAGCRWRKMDYSQIEYRLLAHYGLGRGAEEIRQRYRSDPRTDYHSLTAELVRHFTGIELERGPTKGINFGLVYGMGRDKLLRSLGLGPEIGAQLYNAYFEANPSVRHTSQAAERIAKRRGYVTTILGRRRRFPDGSGTHKALNAVLQGSAADVMKKGMLDCYRAGVFKVTGTPHLTVHDELDWSDDNTPAAQAAFKEAQWLLENCVPLKVPLVVESLSGANWGACK